jgi:alpha-L-fucosidase
MRLIPVMLIAAAAAAQNFADVRPSPQQVAWQDLEIGALVHFGPNTFMDREWGDGTADPGVFHPASLDAEQWVTAAKAAGAQYLIMVAKHHDGFCLWPSRQTKYSVAASPWKAGKGDVVREVAAACRKHGLRFGAYLSPWDRHEPAYKDNAAYDNYYARQITELATRYGPITECWLDGAGSEGHVYDFERYIRTLRTYQPNALVFADVGLLPWADIRWVGNESGFANEENWNVVDAYRVLRWRPAECDTPLRVRHWFWHPNDEKSLKPVAKLLENYNQSVGRGAQLVLGLAPDDRGLLPESDVARLREFGAELRRLYGNNLARKPEHAALDGDPDTVWEAPSYRAEVPVWFARPTAIDRTVAMEWLNAGQRVQKYDVQVLEKGEWRTVAAGTTIGHKKIDIFPRVTASAVRLRILMALDAPRISEFQVYDGGA